MKKVFLLLALAFHVSVVAYGMVRHLVTHPEVQKVMHAGDGYVILYEAVTGAGGGFGFFSPNIGNQFLVRFQMDGQGKAVEMKELVSDEVSVRTINMNRYFVEKFENEKSKRAIAASLSAYIFNKFPNLKSLEFIVDFYKLPSIAEYREGQRPSTSEVYRAKFNLTSRM